MVESAFGHEMADAVITESNLKSDGVFTSVGTYDHEELFSMVTTLSEETQLPVSDLVKAFGRYLFKRFTVLFPIFFDFDNSFEFLNSIHDVVHVEVLKLYPEATLPDFISEIQDDGKTLHFEYQSPRNLADLAIGLMEGAFEHWNEKVEIERLDRDSPDKQVTLFVCKLID